MIRRLIDAYVTEGKVRMDMTTWLENEHASMGLEAVQNTSLFLTSKETRKLITSLKASLFDLEEDEEIE